MQESATPLVTPRAAPIDFRTAPERYHHWKLSVEGPVAELVMDVDEQGSLVPGYELKLNSYDIGVDLELADAVQRLRFEHPRVKAVVLRSARQGMFCAGANIRMLGRSSHSHKVNFCKFTNETRLAIEDACRHSGQRYLCALDGTAAGGGYELALAAEHIILIDDGNAAVSLPEVSLLGVLPGTGGLTRLVDKRRVRRDLADVFCTVEEGVKGSRAVQWRLVDECVPRSEFEAVVRERAAELVRRSDRPDEGDRLQLGALGRELTDSAIDYPCLRVRIDRDLRVAHLYLDGPADAPPAAPAAIAGRSDGFWPLALTRALDDALLHLRFNERDIGTLVFHTEGDRELVAAHDAFLLENADHWLVRELILYLKRTLKRLDVTSRSLVALVEPGSCWTGMLAEILFAVDRSYMLDGAFEDDARPAPAIRLSAMNFGVLPMGNGLSRLATRFLGEAEALEQARVMAGTDLDAATALDAGLITFAPDDIDWEEEIRLYLEERASFSADALTAMEANLRFAGPETMETRIFGRLAAWQNWVFQRPNAVGESGALSLYGSGRRPEFDRQRV